MEPRLPPTEIENLESGAGTLTSSSDGMISREVELRWIVRSMSGYAAAEAKAIELAPLFYDGHRRGSIQCTPLGGGWYRIAVSYANEGVSAYEEWGIDQTGGAKFVPNGISVDTTGGSELVTQALSAEGLTVETHNDPNKKAPDSYGAINVSGNQVNGIQKTIPTFQFTETWLVPAWYLLGASRRERVEPDTEMTKPAAGKVTYGQTLREMTGTMNDEPFRIFKRGEVLFLGARYDVNRGSTMVPVTYSFSVQLTRRNFMVGDIMVREKRGWDFMWIHYEDAVDAAAFFPVKKPKYVYIDRIYEEGDFTKLQIGEDWSQHWIEQGDTFTHPLAANKKNLS